MALSRSKKEQLVREYGERMERAQVMVWSGFRGLKVGQVADLRRRLRAAGADAVVVKNTLMRIALDGLNLPFDPEIMDGPRMITFVYDDIAPAAKALVGFVRETGDAFEIAGGLVGGKPASADQIRALAELPSREVLLAQVVGGIQAPISSLVGGLAALLRGLLNVLNARSAQLEGSAP